VKGFAAAKFLLENHKGLIGNVTLAPDTGTVDDPLETMVKLFDQFNIRTTLNDPGRISDLAIAVGWKKLIEANYSQVIVIHDSLLPKYRGFNPLLTALINGDTRIGATALIATGEVDAGPIVAQEAKNIKYPMKLEEAMEIISSLIEKLLRRVCYQIEKSGKTTGKPQNHRIASYSLWRDEEDFQIDWNQPADVIVRHIHASSYPYAGAKSFLAEEEIRIFDAKVSKENPTIVNRTPGKIWKLVNGVPVVICGKGLVELTKVSGNNGRSVLPITKLKQRFK
jgi:methionyl-tRNA formyltransferase